MFLDQLLLPYKFYGRDMWEILFFIFASCELLRYSDKTWLVGSGEHKYYPLGLSSLKAHINILFFSTCYALEEFSF